MKAAFFREHGGLDRVEHGDLPEPVAGPGQVRLRIFQLPSGWRHAVPYAWRSFPPMRTVCWYSRQYCPRSVL